jgi:hypothetical protein
VIPISKMFFNLDTIDDLNCYVHHIGIRAVLHIRNLNLHSVCPLWGYIKRGAIVLRASSFFLWHILYVAAFHSNSKGAKD